MPTPPENRKSFQSLVDIVTHLRGPEGCPWDKEQTHESLRRYIIEEAYEVIDAIDAGHYPELQEELGDLLFQVVLHSELARQSGHFCIEDVVESISEKMVRRHPHVFSDQKVKGTNEVLENWETLKSKEKKKVPGFNLPKHLPALIASQKIGEKTRKFNFDWDSPSAVLLKVQEELDELKEAIDSGTQKEREHEIGDLLFSVVQLARHLNVEAEGALKTTNIRFENRFIHMQKESADTTLSNLSSEELEKLWQNAKAALKNQE